MSQTEFEEIEARKVKEIAVLRDQWIADVKNAGTVLGLEAWVISRNRLRELQRIFDTAAKGRAGNCLNDRYIPSLMELIVAKSSINGDEQMESVLAEAKNLLASATAIADELGAVRTKHVSGLP